MCVVVSCASLSYLPAPLLIVHCMFLPGFFLCLYKHICVYIYINTLKRKYFNIPVSFYYAVLQIEYLGAHSRYVNVYICVCMYTLFFHWF